MVHPFPNQIDMKSVERILIVPDDMSALNLVNSAGSVPRNLKYAITLGYSQFYPAPCRTYSVAPGRNPPRILSSSVDQLVEKLEQVIRKSLHTVD